MTTFDDILPKLGRLFHQYATELLPLCPIAINRDLNGRVRLIAPEHHREHPVWDELATAIFEALHPHAPAPHRLFLWEDDVQEVCEQGHAFSLWTALDEDVPCRDGVALQVQVIDRLVTESNWADITSPSATSKRVVFFSIKGGVGRSTALGATAWWLAEQGQRVLVLDMDLESPGLSSALLPAERCPQWGIADWLLEDLVDNGAVVLNDMVGSSTLSRNGDIWVVPAHGHAVGDYVSKLGRVWMPKVSAEGTQEAWPDRLNRLIEQLEHRYRPDVVLIDCRAGIDEVASACVTHLGAALVLLFALTGEQTWSGYRMLFRHWRTRGVAQRIRDRLQLVAAMLPETNTAQHLAHLRERAWDVFGSELYDQLDGAEEGFNFDVGDEFAPHSPVPIRWNRGFEAIPHLHDRLHTLDKAQFMQVFGDLPTVISNFVATDEAIL